MRNKIIKNKAIKYSLTNNRNPPRDANRNYITNNVDRRRTYSQAVKQDKGEKAQAEENNNVTLIKLLDKLEKQDKKYEEQGQMIKDVLQRLMNLENKSDKVAMPIKRKQRIDKK